MRFLFLLICFIGFNSFGQNCDKYLSKVGIEEGSVFEEDFQKEIVYKRFLLQSRMLTEIYMRFYTDKGKQYFELRQSGSEFDGDKISLGNVPTFAFVFQDGSIYKFQFEQPESEITNGGNREKFNSIELEASFLDLLSSQTLDGVEVLNAYGRGNGEVPKIKVNNLQRKLIIKMSTCFKGATEELN